MNIVVVGGGIAGLAVSAGLRRLRSVKRISILDNASPLTTLNAYLGLWNPSLQCMEVLNVYEKVKKDFHAVGPSAYRNLRGHCLAKPFVGLARPPCKLKVPNLAFISIHDF
jgi:2-polyprenyl-6-methoxyphenol hydroxylase-like FAD-dependent oxidoreductase